MKKRLIAALCAAFAAALLMFFPPSPAPQRPDALPTAEQLDGVEYALKLDPTQHTLSVTMDWAYTNREQAPLRDMAVRLYPNAFALEDTSPAALSDIAGAAYPNGFSKGYALLHDVAWDGQSVPYAYAPDDETVLTLAIPPLGPGQTGRLRLRAVLFIPDCRYLFGRSGGTYMLARCLPFVAQRAGGAWKTAPYPLIGDPETPPLHSVRLTLSLPQGYRAAAPMALAEKKNGDGLMLTGALSAARDLALVVSDSLHTAQKTVQGIAVRSFARSPDRAQKALAYAERAFSCYLRRYGPYPYPAYTVVEADIPFDGAEHTALSLVGGGRYAADSALELTVAHETAHQWFGVMVASDPINDPWMDEAPSEYALLRYALDSYGQAAYEQLVFLRADAPMRETHRREITAASPVERFASLDEYGSVVCGRGLSLLLALDRHLDVDALLRRYAAAYAFRTATRQDFEDMALAAADGDIRPLIADYLDTAI